MQLATLEKYEDVLARVNTAAAERMHALRANPASFQTNIIDVCPSPYTLAQQLTHIELVGEREVRGLDRDGGWRKVCQSEVCNLTNI